MGSLTQGLHPIVYYRHLILANIESNNNVVEAVAHLLDRGLPGVPVHAGELSFVVCGLSCVRATRRKIWAEIFSFPRDLPTCREILVFYKIYED